MPRSVILVNDNASVPNMKINTKESFMKDPSYEEDSLFYFLL